MNFQDILIISFISHSFNKYIGIFGSLVKEKESLDGGIAVRLDPLQHAGGYSAEVDVLHVQLSRGYLVTLPIDRSSHASKPS
jgi:hypothetical protein